MFEQFTTIIIGFGKAGKTLAGKLAKAGEKVALIEKDANRYGGTCINVACIPSKRLITEALKAPQDSFEAQRCYYKKTILGKRELVTALRQGNYKKVATAGVEIIDGTASFVDAKTVSVALNSGGERTLTADKIVINTGARPFVPEIEGIANNPHVYLSETLMDLEALPARLTIIGGGFIGLEFASMYSHFGSQVTVLQDTELFLPQEDRDMADTFEASLQALGIQIIKGAQITRIEGGQLTYVQGDQSQVLEGDVILVATGRRPNTVGLNLQAAGIELTERGGIKTNDYLRTNVPHIWAAGDVCGNLQFTYVSLDDSRIIFDDMTGQAKRNIHNRGAFPSSVFIDPPYSKVGLDETQAQAQGRKYRLVTLQAADIPKAKVLRQTTGLLKALIDSDTQEILGATLFCAESHEIINQIKLVMDAHLPYTVLRDSMFTHPSMAEGLNDLFAN